MILFDLVQQRSIADLKQSRRRLAIPACFLQSRSDRVPFRLRFYILDQGFQRSWAGLFRFGISRLKLRNSRGRRQ